MLVICLLQKRHLLEDSNQLDARRSALDDDLEEMEEDEEEGEFKVGHGTSTSLAAFTYFLHFLSVTVITVCFGQIRGVCQYLYLGRL